MTTSRRADPATLTDEAIRAEHDAAMKKLVEDYVVPVFLAATFCTLAAVAVIEFLNRL